MEVAAAGRFLQGCDAITGTSEEVAQLIQGTAFLGLSMFLIFMNNAKVAMIQRAPLEQRLSLCITLSTVVALFSGFFNLMQLTSLNKIALPRSSGYTMNLARPIEWLMTCPILQLILVILGGPRIPSYRRWMMPGLTTSMLICGLAGAFTASGLRFLWFAFGAVIQCGVVYYNVTQISEHSDGEEGFFHGVSDFRKISVKVIIMWYPFPVWYFLSPESLEIITNVEVVNMGWVILNLASKFSFILYLQYIKTTYMRNLEATRELYAVSPATVEGKMEAGNEVVPFEDEVALPGMPTSMLGSAMAESEAKLAALVTDTMCAMGLSQHGQKLFELMKKSGITSPDILEKITEERALDLSLPWSFVKQVKNRWLAEKVALGDDPEKAEMRKEDPFTKLLMENKERLALLQGAVQRQTTGALTPLRGTSVSSPSHGFDVETLLSMLMEKIAEDRSTVLQKLDAQMELLQNRLEYANDAIGQRMDFGQVTVLQSLNNMQAAIFRVDSAQERALQTMDAARGAVERLEQKQAVLLEQQDGAELETKKIVAETVSEASEAMLQKLEVSFQASRDQAEESQRLLQAVAAATSSLSSKADRIEENTSVHRIEGEGRLARTIEELGQQVKQHVTGEVKALVASTEDGLSTLARCNGDVSQKHLDSIAAQEERMGDIRRMNMMVMDTLVAMQEKICSSADTIERNSRLSVLQEADVLPSSCRTEVQSVVQSCMQGIQQQLTQLADGLRSLSQQEGHQDLTALVEALSQQQLSRNADAVLEVREEVRDTLRAELESHRKTLSQAHEAAACQLSEKVDVLKESLAGGLQRLEVGVEKVLQAVPAEQRPRRSTAGEPRG